MSIYRFAPALLAFGFILGACGGAADSNDEADVADAPAAEGPDLEGDLADVTNYELTMDRVERYFAATVNMGRAMQQMTPAEREAFEQTEEQEMPSLDEMAERISAHPETENAVRDANISPREYATIAYALLQAGMAQAFMAMQPGADQDSLARAAGVNPANVAFMRDNAEELGRRQQELAAQMEELGLDE